MEKEELERILDINKASSPYFTEKGEKESIIKKKKWTSYLFFFEHLNPLCIYHPSYTDMKIEKKCSKFEEERRNLSFDANNGRNKIARIKKEKVWEEIERYYQDIYQNNWKRKLEREKNDLLKTRHVIVYERKLDMLPELVKFRYDRNIWVQFFVADDRVVSGYDCSSGGRENMSIMAKNVPKDTPTYVYVLDGYNELILKKTYDKFLVLYSYYAEKSRGIKSIDFDDVGLSHYSLKNHEKIKIDRTPHDKEHLKQLFEHRFKIPFTQNKDLFYCLDGKGGSSGNKCVFKADLGNFKVKEEKLKEFIGKDNEKLHLFVSKSGYEKDAMYYSLKNQKKLRLLDFYEDI